MPALLTTPRSRALATLICLAVAAVGLSACQDTITLPKSDVDYCTIVADPPVKDGKQIVAAGHYTCDGKGADSITITVHLQKKASNGKWTTLTSGTFVAKGVNTTRKRDLGTRTRKVKAACSTGSFRSTTHAVERSHGHSQTYNGLSVSVTSPCNSSF